MKKTFAMFSAALATGILLTSTAFAGQWKQDNIGWWWQNDDGSYPVNQWQWLDGNQDGVSECYYFGADGYMFVNTTTPDGYAVNVDGAWIVNGTVPTQQAAKPQTNTTTTTYATVYRSGNHEDDYDDYEDDYDEYDDYEEYEDSDVNNDYSYEPKPEPETVDEEEDHNAEMRDKIQSMIDDLRDQMTSGFYMTDAQYRKRVDEINDRISKLERQIAALSNSSNRADEAQRLELEQDLSDKEAELEELQNNHSLKAQIESLEEELERYR